MSVTDRDAQSYARNSEYRGVRAGRELVSLVWRDIHLAIGADELSAARDDLGVM